MVFLHSFSTAVCTRCGVTFHGLPYELSSEGTADNGLTFSPLKKYDQIQLFYNRARVLFFGFAWQSG